MASLAFVDTETTGLDPDLHQIWEAAVIVDGQEYEWQLPVDLGRADAVALRIGHFHERYLFDVDEGGRHVERQAVPLDVFAAEFALLTRGRHMVGAVPSFDDERLRKLLRANGACPEWHYHLIDVEALAVGYLNGRWWSDGNRGGVEMALPWRSDDLSRECGVEPPNDEDRHTALGDARWAKRLYEAICGEQ